MFLYIIISVKEITTKLEVKDFREYQLSENITISAIFNDHFIAIIKGEKP